LWVRAPTTKCYSCGNRSGCKALARRPFIVNANAHPAGKLLQPWRRQVDCLFGLAINGGLINNTPNTGNPYDPTGTYPCPYLQLGVGYGNDAERGGSDTSGRLCRLDSTQNGNILKMLQRTHPDGCLRRRGQLLFFAKGLGGQRYRNCSALNATQAGCIYLKQQHWLSRQTTGLTTGWAIGNPAIPVLRLQLSLQPIADRRHELH